MYRVKALAVASCLGLVALSAAYADEWNKKTIMTVNETIQVPGKVLPPGKYVMKLLDSPSNRHIVQIFNADETQIQTTILAIPNYRLQPTGETRFGWWETPAGQPRALRSWFYPGDNFGQEFAYPKGEAAVIAQTSNTSVPVTYSQSESDLATARVGTVDKSGTEGDLDKNTYEQKEVAQSTPPPQPAPEPAPAPAPAPQAETAAPAPEPAPATLPRTASPLPLIGLAGLVSAGAASALRALRRG